MYRYRQAFAAEAKAEDIFQSARDWVERTHRGVNDRIISVDADRRRIAARGAFSNHASDVSAYIYYELNIHVRDGWYGVTYDNFVYQPAPTYHGTPFEIRLPERQSIYRKTLDYIGESLADLASTIPNRRDNLPVRLDSTRFDLVQTPEGYELLARDGTRHPVTPTWLVPPDDPEADPIVVPDRFEETVHAFPIGDGVTGLHLSSYEIQDEGSAQAAVGCDVFLILREDDGRLSDGQLLLGISKLRGRSMGCWQALMHHFLLGDVDGDGLKDIGLVREEVNCVGADIPRPEPRGYPVKWHVFTGPDWEFRPEYDDAIPADVFAMPLLGLRRSPIDFIRAIEDRR